MFPFNLIQANKQELIKKIYSFCERFIQTNRAKVDAEIRLLGETVIVETKSSMMMYSFLQELIADFRGVYGKYAEYGDKYDLVVRGSWANRF